MRAPLLLLGFLAVLAVAACQTDTGSTLAPVGETLQSQEAARCTAQGGTWGRVPNGGAFVCYRQTRDANESCTTSSDCQGVCLARSRTCSPVTPFFGCHDVIGTNGLRSVLCTN